MLRWLTAILGCQLVGEFLAKLLAVSIPGPVIGMLLLFLSLILVGRLPPELGSTGDALLRHLSLLFVPAGTGIVAHAHLLSEAAVPIVVSLVISTATAVVVTGWVMSRLGSCGGWSRK